MSSSQASTVSKKSGKKTAKDGGGGSPSKTIKDTTTTTSNNVRVGTLQEATGAAGNKDNGDHDDNSNSNNNDGSSSNNQDKKYIYCDFAQIEEEEFNVDYETDQEGLAGALEEATAMAATQLSMTGPSPYNSHTTMMSMMMSSSASSRMNRASGWCRSQRFPVKLYALLSQPLLSHIITWMPHGRSWKVLKPREFEASILPVFFESDNYHSFNRVINAWSFRRKSSGPDRGSYFHELFLRGKPHLQKHMRRLPRTHKKLAMAKTEEPDFFELEKVSPLPTLAEAQLRIDARKMRRMHQQYNNGDVLRVPSSTRTNIPPGHLTSEHHQQVNAQRKALKDGEAPEKGGAEKATATEASGSPGDSVDKTAGYQGELMGHGSSSNSRLMEHERFLQMREDQLFYHHQMNMMQANSLGLPYGGMGPLGNSPYNHPYTMAPPS